MQKILMQKNVAVFVDQLQIFHSNRTILLRVRLVETDYVHSLVLNVIDVNVAVRRGAPSSRTLTGGPHTSTAGVSGGLQ